MPKRICLFICGIVISVSLHSQSLGREGSEFVNKIITFYYNQDTAEISAAGKTEAFLLVFDIDSAGKVARINLLGEDKYKDSTYNILSRLRPADFGNWKSEGCKGKTILVPIARFGGSMDFRHFNRITGLDAFQEGEVNNVIILRQIPLGWLEARS